MKTIKQLTILVFLLISTITFAQKHKVDVVIKKGVTTTQRDAFTIPAGQYWEIYNTTTAQREFWNGTAWVTEATGGGTDDQTLQEVTDFGAVTDNPITISETPPGSTRTNTLGVNSFSFFNEINGVQTATYNVKVPTTVVNGTYDIEIPNGTGTLALQEWVTEQGYGTGSGAVDSVNTQTGVVVLDADDIDDTSTTNKFANAQQIAQIAINEGDINTIEAEQIVQNDAIALNTAKVSYPGEEVLNIEQGVFDGVFDVSNGKNNFYDDYGTGATVNLSLGTIKELGTIATVRVKGGLVGTIPTDWSLSGQPITTNISKYNELTLLYVSSGDIRIVNRVVNIIDTESPSTPSNLVASVITDTNFELDFDASTDNIAVTGYKVYQDGIYLKTILSNNTTITGLTPETSYDFTVLAFDLATNESSQSAILTVLTEPEPVASYTFEYQAVLDYATANGYVLPSTAQQDIDNQKIVYLKAEGIWTELDKLYNAKATYTPTSFATNFYRLNWKDPSLYLLTAAGGGEPEFVSGQGWKVSGNSGYYFATGFKAASNAVKFTATDNSIFFKLFDATTTFTSSFYLYGARVSGDNNQMLLGNASLNKMLMRVIRTAGTHIDFIITQANINAHYHITNNADAEDLYVNGVLNEATTGQTTGTLTDVEEYMFSYNNNGTADNGNGGTHGISYLGTGSNLKLKQVEIYNIMNETYTP